jgi:translation initiation factor IF-1
MPDPDTVEVEGKIVAVLPGTMFRVELTNGHQVLAHISGKLRKHFIRIMVGDVVKMEMNTHDLEKARITFRLRGNNPGGPRPGGPYHGSTHRRS